MYFKFKHGIIFSIIVFPLFTTQAVGRNDLAIKKFESAINACEKGLQMNMPKSKGSLIILQNLFKKYQRHRDAALALEGGLKSSEMERYAGSFFSKRSFLEVYQICERDFAEKVAKAETAVTEKMKNLDRQQVQSEADIQVLLEKNQAAKQQVVVAIDKLCASYLLKPEGGTSAPVYKKYQAAKQQALQIYPAIVNQFHTVALTDSATGEAKNVNKTVQAWFDHCETAFTSPATPEKLTTVASDLVAVTSDEEGPMRTSPEEESAGIPPPVESVASSAKEAVTPSASLSEQVSPPATTSTAPEPTAPPTTVAEKTTTPSPHTETAMTTTPTPEVTSSPEQSLTSPQPAQPNSSAENGKTASLNDRASSKDSAAPATEQAQEADDDDAANVDDEMAEYKGIMAKAQGDRLKILKDEKRLPEFVDDQDFNYLKAKIWQYEKPTGDKCNIYTFKGNQLVKTVKNFSGACPPLEPQD